MRERRTILTSNVWLLKVVLHLWPHLRSYCEDTHFCTPICIPSLLFLAAVKITLPERVENHLNSVVQMIRDMVFQILSPFPAGHQCSYNSSPSSRSLTSSNNPSPILVDSWLPFATTRMSSNSPRKSTKVDRWTEILDSQET